MARTWRSPSSRSGHRALRGGRELPLPFLTGLTLTLAWGTFAFGAVYQWAYLPLAAACSALGAIGLLIGRHGPHVPVMRPLIGALAAMMAIGLLQIVPLPESVISSISPATDRFLRSYDLGYAASTAVVSAEPLPAPAAWHPLSINPAATMRALVLLGAFMLLLGGLLRTFARYSPARAARMLFVLGIVMALTGIVQKAVLGDHAFGGMRIYGFWTPRYLLTTPFGPFVNKNHFAGWMLMGIPLALGLLTASLSMAGRDTRPHLRDRLLWLSTPQGGQFLLAVFGVTLMGLALLMTRSRSGIACFLATVALTGFLAARSARGMRQGVLALGALLAVLMVSLLWAGSDSPLTRVGSSSDSLQLRLDIWKDAIAIVRDFPLVGTGLNTFGTATVLYQTTRPDLHFQETHNDYLQLVTEGGLGLAVVVVFLAAAIAWAIARRFRSNDDDEEGYWLRAGATVGLIAIGLQSTVEFSLQMPGNAAVFVLLLAIALHRRADSSRRDVTLAPSSRSRVAS